MNFLKESMLNHQRKTSIKEIIEVDSINNTILKRLFNDEILAVRVSNYYDKNVCNTVSQSFLKSKKVECYHHEVSEDGKVQYIDYGVDRYGCSFNTTYNGDYSAIERYYGEAVPTIKEVRDIFSKNISPYDKFRLELDEVWNGSVGLANYEGKKMLAGIVRVMNRYSESIKLEEQPHVDALPRKYKNLAGQFAVNIYLSIPKNGGELELWDVPSLDVESCLNLPSNYNWREVLPKSIIIKPRVGELVIFNTRKPHAVRRIFTGARVSIQSFIGLGYDHSLYLWA